MRSLLGFVLCCALTAGARGALLGVDFAQVNFNGGASHETITFMNGAFIDPTDVVFG